MNCLQSGGSVAAGLAVILAMHVSGCEDPAAESRPSTEIAASQPIVATAPHVEGPERILSRRSVLKGLYGGAEDLQFVGDGETLAVASIFLGTLPKTGALTLLKAEDASVLEHKSVSPGYTHLCSAPDGELLALAWYPAFIVARSVSVWQLSGFKLTGVISQQPADWQAMSLSPDGNTLALLSSCEPGDNVHLLDVKTRSVFRKLGGDAGCVAFSPAGFLLATENGEGVTLWSTKTWTKLATLSNRNSAGKAGAYLIAFSADGKSLFMAGADASIWDVAARKRVCVVDAGTGLHDAAFSPDGRMLAIAAGHDGIKLFDARTGKLLERISQKGFTVWCVAFSPDGRILASGGGPQFDESGKGHVVLWDVAKRRP